MPTLAPLVREITPSIVNIAIQGREELEYDVQAIGSGVIVDAQNAYVLTANHVVAQVSTVQAPHARESRIGNDAAIADCRCRLACG